MKLSFLAFCVVILVAFAVSDASPFGDLVKGTVGKAAGAFKNVAGALGLDDEDSANDDEDQWRGKPERFG